MSFSRGALVRTTQASRSEFSEKDLVTFTHTVDLAVLRHESTSSTAGPSSAPLVTPTTTPPSPFPPLRASLLLSRPPLIQRTPHELETAYYIHSLRMRQALSNHIPESFYFRSGSLPHRRYKIAAHAFDVAAFGPEIAGPAPNVGEIPEERPIEAMPRDKWWKEDGERGNKSLERYPEDEVFCLVQDKSGEKKWGFPEVVVREGETLHGALETGLTSVDGALGGQTMDTWIVTRKPIGVVRDGQERVRPPSIAPRYACRIN